MLSYSVLGLLVSELPELSMVRSLGYPWMGYNYIKVNECKGDFASTIPRKSKTGLSGLLDTLETLIYVEKVDHSVSL